MSDIPLPSLWEILILLFIPGVIIFLLLVRKSTKKKNGNPDNATDNTTKETGYLSFKGRIRRRDYIIRFLILLIPYSIFYILSGEIIAPEIKIFTTIGMMSCVLLLMVQGVKRLHDINLSGAYILLAFFPAINLLLNFFLMLKGGSSGPNEFGIDPRENASIAQEASV